MSESYPFKTRKLEVDHSNARTRSYDWSSNTVPLNFNPRHIIDIIPRAQMHPFHPRTGYIATEKRKRKKSRHFPYMKLYTAMVPKHRFGIMKWVSDDLSYVPAATAGSIAIYMNSMNDPGAALSATLPQWWTELSAIYKRYRVHSCHYWIHMSNTTVDQVQGGYCVTSSEEVPPGTAAGLTEAIQKGSAFWLGATDENLTNHTDIKGFWSLKKVAKSKGTVAEDYSADVTNNPTRSYGLTVVLGSAANLSIKYRVVCTYWVELYEYQQNAPD